MCSYDTLLAQISSFLLADLQIRMVKTSIQSGVRGMKYSKTSRKLSQKVRKKVRKRTKWTKTEEKVKRRNSIEYER